MAQNPEKMEQALHTSFAFNESIPQLLSTHVGQDFDTNAGSIDALLKIRQLRKEFDLDAIDKLSADARVAELQEDPMKMAAYNQVRYMQQAGQLIAKNEGLRRMYGQSINGYLTLSKLLQQKTEQAELTKMLDPTVASNVAENVILSSKSSRLV